MPAESNALLGIDVNPDTSNEPEILQFWNADPANDVRYNVGHSNGPAISKNAPPPTILIVEGRVPLNLEERNPPELMVVNGILLRLVMVTRFVQDLNASVPIVSSRLVVLRDTLLRFVQF